MFREIVIELERLLTPHENQRRDVYHDSKVEFNIENYDFIC